jgi:glutathione synthase/RimK-type ligase-like ATP-grasp enzyme
LLEYEGVRWVNNRSAIDRARPKLHQLFIAKKLGFRIPDSVVTNQETLLSEFSERHGGKVVAKPIQTQIIVSAKGELVVGTRSLMGSDLRSAVQFFPCFAQERLKFLFEVRVIVFGDQLFAFRLKPSVPADDLKQLKLSQIGHSIWALDPSMEHKIRKFMSHYSLEFGAFDFGVVDGDEPYFLELNPNGQWLWLQFMTGCDLETPFIELLLS